MLSSLLSKVRTRKGLLQCQQQQQRCPTETAVYALALSRVSMKSDISWKVGPSCLIISPGKESDNN